MSFNDVSRGGPSSHHEKKQTNNVSHPQEKKKLMSTMSQFSRTDSLLFKDSKRLIHESRP